MSPTIAIVSILGDARNPSVWSGTPSNLASALESLGCSIASVSVRPNLVGRQALKAASILTGNGPDYSRTWISPLVAGLCLARGLHRGTSTCLHMGTATAPVAEGRGSGHAIYLDCTFHLMAAQRPSLYSDRFRRAYDLFERRALTSAEHVFTVSQYVRRDVIEYYAVPTERVTIVGTGRGNISPFEGPKDYSKRMILFVAKDRFEEKGGPLLLDGVRIAARSDPRLRLVVVAQERYRATVESVPGATFKTALVWEDLQALFRSASLFAMPAKHEPWGIVYLEALASRTPIMGLNLNALPELTRDRQAGFLLETDTPEAVAGCLLDAFSNTNRLAEMGLAGQRHVLAHYTWENTALKIYSALFGTPAGAASASVPAFPGSERSLAGAISPGQ